MKFNNSIKVILENDATNIQKVQEASLMQHDEQEMAEYIGDMSLDDYLDYLREAKSQLYNVIMQDLTEEMVANRGELEAAFSDEEPDISSVTQSSGVSAPAPRNSNVL